LDHKNNYIEHLNIDDIAVKNFNILETSLNILHNYFDGPNKIIFKSVTKFLDASAKLFFLYEILCNITETSNR